MFLKFNHESTMILLILCFEIIEFVNDEKKNQITSGATKVIVETSLPTNWLLF